jgi:hypothetical protein
MFFGAKNDPRIWPVVLMRQSGETIRTGKIPATDGRGEC